MDKDQQLIYEAYSLQSESYLQENRIKTTAMAILCALGIGCSSIQQHQQKRDPNSQPPADVIDWMKGLAPDLLNLWIHGANSNDELMLKLQADIEKQLEKGDAPKHGWGPWLENWFKKHTTV